MIRSITPLDGSYAHEIRGSYDFVIGHHPLGSFSRGSVLYSRLIIDGYYQLAEDKMHELLPRINAARLIAEYLIFLFRQIHPTRNIAEIRSWKFLETISRDYHNEGCFPISFESDVDCIARHIQRLSSP